MKTKQQPIPWDTLIKFCYKDKSRPMLTQPFTVKGHTIATDGKRFLAVESVGYPELSDEHQSTITEDLRKHASRILCDDIGRWKFEKSDMLVQNVDIQCSESVCPHCNEQGMMKAYDRCPECDGVGEVECDHCGQDTDCDTCNGQGTVQSKDRFTHCTHCDGTKIIREFIPDKCRINEDGSLVKSELLWDILQLPAVSLMKSGTGYPVALGEPIPFYGPGYSGAIMPLRHY